MQSCLSVTGTVSYSFPQMLGLHCDLITGHIAYMVDRKGIIMSYVAFCPSQNHGIICLEKTFKTIGSDPQFAF